MEKYGVVGQTADDRITHRMPFTCRINNARIETHIMK
jgi:hypothetical protein